MGFLICLYLRYSVAKFFFLGGEYGPHEFIGFRRNRAASANHGAGSRRRVVCRGAEFD